MPDILSVADHADMIVNGYAFSKSNDSVRVLNLNNPASACVLSADGKVLETTMDDIELAIVQDYYSRNRKHLEESLCRIIMISKFAVTIFILPRTASLNVCTSMPVTVN